MSAMEIHYELHLVCSQNVMNEGALRQWYGMLKDGCRNEQMFSMKSEVVSHLQ
jgi:hypothetical protein